jgi:hypothetical protein
VCRLAEEQRGTCGRPLEAEQDAHQRRLAAAVRSGDGDELALAQLEIDVLEDALTRPVAEGHPCEQDR